MKRTYSNSCSDALLQHGFFTFPSLSIPAMLEILPNHHLYGEFHRHWGTQKWMVYMENPVEMDDLGGPPYMETTTII